MRPLPLAAILLVCCACAPPTVDDLLDKWERKQDDVPFHEIDTPLHYYVWREDTLAVRLLLEAGLDPDIATMHGGPAVEWAVASGNVHSIRLLMDAGTDLNRRRPRDMWTLLHIVALSVEDIGDRDRVAAVVDLLIEEGVDPTAVDAEGRTPADLLWEVTTGRFR